MRAPKLEEPSLPATARRAAATLRTGWTTGTCSAAAAKAACSALVAGVPQSRVEVGLPIGKRAAFEVERCDLGSGWAEAVVIKDAGDDPDVTHGARLTARVSWTKEPGLHLEAGEGVGVVTMQGLGLPIGEPAINPAPRRQIRQAVEEALASADEEGTPTASEACNPDAILDRMGLRVVISVPGGVEMARKTTNPRLGIIGGISILGTTGIVRPFSTAAWRASVGQAIDVIAARRLDTVVLTTGGRTEKAAMALFPNLEEVCFIEVGDFTGYALRRAAKRGIRRCIFVGMAGKLTKLAQGVMMTHWTRSRIDAELLACLTAEAGGEPSLAEAVSAAPTARRAYELWTQAGLRRASDLLCFIAADNLSRYVNRALKIEVVLVDFETLRPVGRGRA